MMKRTISAKIVADSIDHRGNRITSFILVYPRFIHSEVMTHRMFSRNSASSRAIPFNKMIELIKEDPFIPIAFQQDHRGMQGKKYFVGWRLEVVRKAWIAASKAAIFASIKLHKLGVTKQLANRLLEPFLWHTNLVTATEFDNFFNLRLPKYEFIDYNYKESKKLEFCSKIDAISSLGANRRISVTEDKSPVLLNDLTELDWIKLSTSGAEIHIQALAEAMWDARNQSTPKKLKSGEWHIPFGDSISLPSSIWVPKGLTSNDSIQFKKVMIATSRCARLSYMTFDGEINYEKDISMHNVLLNNKHMSPFEHCARIASDEEYRNNARGKVSSTLESEGWFDNFRGFISYRYLIENKNNLMDPKLKNLEKSLSNDADLGAAVRQYIRDN